MSNKQPHRQDNWTERKTKLWDDYMKFESASENTDYRQNPPSVRWQLIADELGRSVSWCKEVQSKQLSGNVPLSYRKRKENN